MKQNRMIACTLAVLLLVSALSGCGGSSSDQDPDFQASVQLVTIPKQQTTTHAVSDDAAISGEVTLVASMSVAGILQCSLENGTGFDIEVAQNFKLELVVNSRYEEVDLSAISMEGEGTALPSGQATTLQTDLSSLEISAGDYYRVSRYYTDREGNEYTVTSGFTVTE